MIQNLKTTSKITTALVLFLIFSAALPAAAQPVKVLVSIGPQKYFLEQIGGSLVDVLVMVPPGASPAVYEPRPGQMALLSQAAAYFTIGVPFERVWLDRFKAANPGMLVVDTAAEIVKQPVDAHDHEAEKDHHAGHGFLDPHIWLDPALVRKQARNILKGLIRIDPAHRPDYEAGCRSFIDQVDHLDKEIRDILKDQSGRRFLVFHPAWGYFARAYGLKQTAVEIEGKSPKPTQLGKLIKQARQAGIKAIFVQPQFSKKSADVIARAIGGVVIEADPLAEDWADNLKRTALKFKAAIK